MSIVRAARKSNFYMLPASVIEDKRLSWAARGLLVYLLSKPDNWRVQITDLLNQTKQAIGGRSGRDKVYKLINELRASGYLYQEFIREGGNFRGVEYEVSDTPDLEQAALYVASLQTKAASRDKQAPEQPFTGLPETVAPYTETPFTGKPETLDKTERATKTEKAITYGDPGQAEESTGGDLPSAVTAKAHSAAPGEPANYPQNPAKPSYAPWHAYARAYRARHQSWPVCNPAVLSKMSQVAARVGELAALTASYYVTHDSATHLVTACHPVGALLSNCEGYATRAQQAERVKQVQAQAVRSAENAPVTAADLIPTPKPAPAKSRQAGNAALKAIKPRRTAVESAGVAA